MGVMTTHRLDLNKNALEMGNIYFGHYEPADDDDGEEYYEIKKKSSWFATHDQIITLTPKELFRLKDELDTMEWKSDATSR